MFGADVRWSLPFLDHNSYLQLNLQNMFDRFYISRATTNANDVNFPIPGTTKTFFASTPAYFVGTAGFNANIALRTSGNKQTVTIRADSQFRGANISLSR